MAVAWRVDVLAKRKGWNARGLADEAGVDIKSARNILMGRAIRVDLETIGRIADALGVKPTPPGSDGRRGWHGVEGGQQIPVSSAPHPICDAL